MPNYVLRITVNGKSVTHQLLPDNVLTLQADKAAKYEILDENQNVVEELVGHIKDDNLYLFSAMSDRPLVILEDYAYHHPITGEGAASFYIDEVLSSEINVFPNEVSSSNNAVSSSNNAVNLAAVGSIALFGTGLALLGNSSKLDTSDDSLFIGDDKNNVLIGTSDNDLLDGKLGNDTLIGGTGADIFIFSSRLDGSVDKIVDFNIQEGDRIKLSQEIFSAIRSENEIMNFISYDKQTGSLSYAAEGIYSGTSIEFARLTENLELSSHQFILG